MNALALLDELLAAGIRLQRDGHDLIADVLPTADLNQHRDRITANKPALVAALGLQAQITAAATAATDAFDRRLYDGLWARWYALEREEATP